MAKTIENDIDKRRPKGPDEKGLPKLPGPLSDSDIAAKGRREVQEVIAKIDADPLFREDDGQDEKMKQLLSEMGKKNDEYNELRERAVKARKSGDYDERQKFIEDMLGNIDVEPVRSGGKMDEGKIEEALFGLSIFGYSVSAIEGLEEKAKMLRGKLELTDEESRVLGDILATMKDIQEDENRHRIEPAIPKEDDD